MSALILPRRFRTQPSGPVRLRDELIPYSAALPWLSSGPALPDVHGPAWSTANPPAISASYTPLGGAALRNTSSGYWSRPASELVSGPLTVVIVFTPDTAINQYGLWSLGNTNTDVGPQWLIQRSGADIRCYAAGSYRTQHVGAVSAGKTSTLVASLSDISNSAINARLTLAVDGRQLNTVITNLGIYSRSTEYLGAGYPSIHPGRYHLHAAFRRYLHADDAAALSREPWSAFQPRSRVLYFGLSGGAAALAGLASAQAAAGGALTSAIPVAAAAVVVASAAGALSTQIPLAALAGADASAAAALASGIPLAAPAAAISLAAGTLTTTLTLSGSALASALAAAGLDTALLLAASAAGQAGAAGALSSGAGLAADAAGVSAAAASLTAQIRLDGVALAAALAAAGLGTAPAGLSGIAAARSQAASTLLTGIPLAAPAQASSSAVGGLASGIPLASAAASVSAASGDLTVEFTFTGTALASALSGGDLTTAIHLEAAALAQAVAAGALGVGLALPARLSHLVEASAGIWQIEANHAHWEIAA